MKGIVFYNLIRVSLLYIQLTTKILIKTSEKIETHLFGIDPFQFHLSLEHFPFS